jgi:hypothetical protein
MVKRSHLVSSKYRTSAASQLSLAAPTMVSVLLDRWLCLSDMKDDA